MKFKTNTHLHLSLSKNFKVVLCKYHSYDIFFHNETVNRYEI